MKNKRDTIIGVIFFCVVILLFNSSVSLAAVKYGVSVGGNRDYPGGDYLIITTKNIDQCVRNCADDDTCQAFSYNPSSQECSLKDRIPEPVRKRGMKSGHKLSGSGNTGVSVPSQPPKMKIMRQVNLPGRDYRQLTVNKAERCSNQCLKDTHCKAFTYNRKTLICWLKSGKPAEKHQQHYVSGIKYYK